MISKDEYKLLKKYLKKKKIKTKKEHALSMQLLMDKFITNAHYADHSELAINTNGIRAIEEYKAKHKSSTISIISLIISSATFFLSVLLPGLIEFIKFLLCA